MPAEPKHAVSPSPSYNISLHLTIYLTLSGPVAAVEDQNSWAREALRSVRSTVN